MDETVKRRRSAPVVLISALIGAAVFLLLYGTHVLNPAYTDWLMDGGSLSKGFLGWRLFQDASWQTMPGAIASLGYPAQASLAGTDSVPLLALLFKLLAPLHDGPFQYFGWWGLACFALQGWFGALICVRVTRSFWQALFGSFLFILSPVLWQGTFFSAGMGAHWVILAALLPLVYRKELSARRKLPYFIWGLLGAISIFIHGQLALICGLSCVAYCVYAVWTTGKPAKGFPLIIFFLVALVSGWTAGSFAGGGLGDIRLFGINVSALWDAHSYSRVLQNFSSPGDYQYAGFAYLGFGVLLLSVMAIVWVAKSFFAVPGYAKTFLAEIKAHLADVAAFAFFFLACIVLGLAQPLVYLLMTLVLSVLAYKMSRKLLTAALACCLLMQAYDASAVFEVRSLHYNQTTHYENPVDTTDMDVLLQRAIWSTVLVSPAVSESIYLPPLAEAVAESGQTLNALSYADDLSVTNWENAVADPQADMVFIFTAEELLDGKQFQSVFAHIGYLYQWNELVIGLVKPTLLPFPQILSSDDIAFLYRFPFGKNSHLKGGEDIGGIRYIYPGGLSYGPYLDLAPGQYELHITGERLDEAGFTFTLRSGEMDQTEISSLPSERVYRLDVSEAVTDLEVLIETSTQQPLFFDSMTVTQLDQGA